MNKYVELIHHFLEQSAQLYPGKMAVVHEERRITYAEINMFANNLAHSFLKNGVKKGDRIAILFENSIEFVISYYAALKAGAVVSPLSSDSKPDTLTPILQQLQPAIIVVSRRFSHLIKAVGPLVLEFRLYVQQLESTPLVSFTNACCWNEHMSRGDGENLNVEIKVTDLSCIIFTSGSTGVPKGVMLSHQNIVSNTSSICQYQQLTKEDKHMVILPFFYVMGLSVLNSHIAVSGSLVLNNKFAYPASVLEQMVSENVTGFSGVPSTYAFLLHRSPLKEYKNRLTALRFCAQAGGHMSDKIKLELRDALPTNTDIFIMYGATEASARLAYLDPREYMNKLGSIGKAIPGVDLKVVDINGNEMPTNEVGELVASGKNIMQGYLNDPQSTKRVLNEFGYHTGDMAYCDKDGFIYVVGRKDNVLKVGGHKINPQEIENTILDTELAVEVAVFGMPDALLGHKLVALAVAKHDDVDEKSVLSECYKRLPKHKLPSGIKLLRELPKKANGKLDYARFNEVYESLV